MPEKILEATYFSPSSGLPDVPENHNVETDKITPKDEMTELEIMQTNSKTKESADHSENNWKMVLGELKKILEK